MLSLGVGALQLMLDRGGEVDWFSSAEIWIELGLAITGFWVFIVHMLTAENPFIDPTIFVDRNFATGLVFIFVDRHHPARQPGAAAADAAATSSAIRRSPTGIVMAPRGVGTMISMILVGRLVRHRRRAHPGRHRPAADRLSLYDMTGFTPQMDD